MVVASWMRRIIVGTQLAASACAHDRLAIESREGPAPGRVERAGDLRRHVRAVRRTPPRAVERPGGSTTSQREGRAELVDGAMLPGSGRSDIAGPVKAHGEHLVLLHGRELLVVTTGAQMRVVAREYLGYSHEPALLVHGDQVLVLRPRFPRQFRSKHLELRRYTIAADGRLTPRDTVHLRGSFAANMDEMRIAGDTLLLYQHYDLDGGDWGRPEPHGMPAIYRAGRWQRLLRPTDVQRPVHPSTTLHVLLRCSLAPRMACAAAGVLAPADWQQQYDDDALVIWADGHVWRLPFDGAPATAVRIGHAPLDRLTWRLDRGGVDAVVSTSDGVLALVRVPAATLRAGLATLGPGDIRPLARIGEGSDSIFVAVRIVGDHVLHSDYNYDHEAGTCVSSGTLSVHPIAGGAPVRLAIPHCIRRIDGVGDGALVTDAPAESHIAPTHLTAIDLSGVPTLGDTRAYTGVAERELRENGPYRLGGTLRGLPPLGLAPLRVVASAGPHLRDVGVVPGHGEQVHAFAFDGRIFVVRDERLVEVEVRGDELVAVRSASLAK